MTFEYIPVPAAYLEHETYTQYAFRLEALGFDEMRIRKAVLEHFPQVDFSEDSIFKSASDARIRYVTMIHKITPAKPHKGLVKKLSASLSLSEDDAEAAVCQFEELGGLPYIPWVPVRDDRNQV